ncbi:hypothetical protein [Nonomuraea glycinis]|uniref:hypothetical protein n=1 Tax=Nonomuraea glycinis TaxID=2047744 RepID=UPI002E100D13|nr:hypothetical protein OHA68_32915 [Nonomuraea glycinis]
MDECRADVMEVKRRNRRSAPGSSGAAVEQVLPRRSASAVRSQGLSLVRALLADRTVRRMWARPPAEHSSYVVSTQSQVWARTLTDSHLGVRPDQSIGT